MHATALPGNTGSNRHPVDQLAEVRDRIKELEQFEIRLKDEISSLMGPADSLGGDEFIARQTLQSRKGGLDEKKVAQKLGDLTPYRKPDSTFVVLRVERRVQAEAAE